ncbi:MAG: efflux RND transporter periplasmic adaptor subunit [Hahellaceae bacterium]|nr:efflux RND transporter periplasmic adaptor subunit [Hahellaceae bacterium]
MKKLGMILLMLVSLGAGVALQKYGAHYLGLAQAPDAAASSPASAAQPLYWVAPMDPNYRRDKPGKSPMGMDLVPVYEEEAADTGTGGVKISPQVVSNLGVRTAPVTQGALELPIQTVGYVSFDEERLRHIHSRVEGWIEVLTVTSEGDPVKQGQTLFELYSPALVNAQEEYLAAVRSGNRLLQTASKARLQSLGLSQSQISALEKRGKVDQRIKVLADEAGIVSQLNVRQGMFIKPASEVMAIGSLQTVWVIAEVFERQASWVQRGQTVSMTLPALPGKVWEGKVDYLYPVLDGKTRTLKVRVRVDNPSQQLKPNMFANLTLFSRVADAAVSMPREALIRGGRYDRVVVALGDGNFKSVQVAAGVEAGGRVQILDGLRPGDQVVTSAQFLIDSESNLDAEIARMEARQDAAPIVPAEVSATGMLEKVLPEQEKVTIQHDPIAAWQWPAMKMDFPVADGVSLAGLHAGQAVQFQLTKTGDTEFWVTAIAETSSAAPGAEKTSEATGSKRVIVTGEVKNWMPEMGMVEVVHDPIPDWQWPTMRMSFTLASNEPAPALKSGDRIRFTLWESEDGDYLMSDIEVMP